MTDGRKSSVVQRAKLPLLIVMALLLIGLVLGWHNRSGAGEPPGLDLVGYNYTDHHIENYSVDGLSGGIVRVSSATSGGSNSVCCVPMLDNKSQSVYVRVRWQAGGCSYIVKDPISGASGSDDYYYYREAYVKVPPFAGNKPRHLETHFFPDGTVKVQITEEMSSPVLRLDESRLQQTIFPRCKNDEKPE